MSCKSLRKFFRKKFFIVNRLCILRAGIAGKRTIVCVESNDGTFQPRKVVIGQSIEGRVPVIEGLASGEHAVVRGALLLDGEAEQLL